MRQEHPSASVSKGTCHEWSASSGPAEGGTSVTRGSETDALEALKARGFTASFVADNGSLRLLGEHRDYRPDELAVRVYQRFEGVSDPDDMSIVYAIETTDGIRGTLVDAFGVYANPAVTAVMDEVTARCEALPGRPA